MKSQPGLWNVGSILVKLDPSFNIERKGVTREARSSSALKVLLWVEGMMLQPPSCAVRANMPTAPS